MFGIKIVIEMDSEIEEMFDPRQCLPHELRIMSSGTHLYKIGLSLHRPENVTRSKFRYPLFIFTLEIYYIIRSILVMVLPEQSPHFYRLLGDFGYVFGTKVHFALTVIFSILLAVNSHLLNYFNYKMKIETTYFKLFDMMCGTIPPKAIGLSDKRIIEKLLRRARLLFLVGDHVPLSLGSSIIFINLFSFYSISTYEEILLYVIPNSLGWFVVVNIVYSIILWQLIYFYLITFYLKSKLKEINQSLKSLGRPQIEHRINFIRVIKGLSAVYTEIAEYDHIYWSKFLLFVWMTCATILSTLTYFVIFGEMFLIIRIFCMYFNVFFILMLLWVVNICATVFLEVNKSYKYLNTVMTKWNRRSVCKGFKLLALIERIGKKRIGFHCWKLFIISSFRGYEIITYCIILFMKVIQMSRKKVTPNL